MTILGANDVASLVVAKPFYVAPRYLLDLTSAL